MPVLVTCYKCGRKLRIHDFLIGRKARCPVCKSIFMTEGNPPAPPASGEWEIQGAGEFQIAPYGSAPPVRRPPPVSVDEQVLEGVVHATKAPQPEYPRPVRTLRRKPIQQFSLENVRMGVMLKLLGVVVQVLIGIVLFVLIVSVGLDNLRSRQDRPFDPEALAGAGAGMAGLLILVLLLSFVAVSLSIAGYAFCVAAPQKHGTNILAIIVLILAVVSLFIQCLAIIFTPTQLVASLISCVESFVFLFFLRALARCLDSRDLEDRITTTMKLLGSTIGWFVTIPVVILLLAASGLFDPKDQLSYVSAMCLVGGFICIGCILGLAYMIWLIWSLAEARYEIGYYLDRHY
jgi:hypothetical protein